jgi:polyisoprenoid-binding protein YceI
LALAVGLVAPVLTARDAAGATAGTGPGAATEHVTLAPSDATIAYTVYALGFLPLHAVFRSFSGHVDVSPGTPPTCHVDVTIAVGSLHMDDPARQQQALGPAMLNARAFPTMHFSGNCVPAGIEGALTLHGVTRSVTLTLRQNSDLLVCSGSINRADFGVNGLPGLVGSRVLLRLTMRAPAELRAAISK